MEYLVTKDILLEAYEVQNLGSRIAKKSDVIEVKGCNERVFKREVLRNSKAKESDNVKSSQIKLHSKVPHKLITSYISPKNGSYQYVNATNLCIIWHIQNQRDLNLCYLMMENMKAIERSRRTKALSYGMILTELFRFLGVELSQEVYANVSDKGIINESVVRRTLT